MKTVEPYVGIAVRRELLSASQQRCPGETARAFALVYERFNISEVAKANGRSKKVTTDMKVAANLLSGRLVHCERYVLRRTARSCRQMLQADGLGVNTKKVLEYLWERACEEASRRGYPGMAKVDQR